MSKIILVGMRDDAEAYCRAALNDASAGPKFYAHQVLMLLDHIDDLESQLAESQAREADLVGVIKELVATLEHIKKNAHFTGPDLDAADALESTREIRERIGAT